MRRWTESEWEYCLACFKTHATVAEALKYFHKKYPKRSRHSVRHKFQEMLGKAPQEVVSTAAGVDEVSKKAIVSELKRLYKLLGGPFGAPQFDEHSKISSNAVIKKFGSWTNALNEAGLTKKFAAHQDLNIEIQTFDADKHVAENWKKKKETLVQRAEDRKIRWLREHMHKVDLLREVLEESVAKVEPLVVEVHPVKTPTHKVQKTSKKNNVTLWFEFSDLQLGTLITSEEMGGLNKHNWVIWQSKLEIWKKEVIKLIRRYSEQFTIDMVVVAALGDFVENIDIFKGQKWQVDRHVVDQALYGANDTAGAFAEIFLTFPDLKFHVLEVFGNHGRIGQKGENPYNCSLDKIYLRLLEYQLKATAPLKNVTYHHNDCYWYLVEIYNWNHLLLHGDQGMSGLWSSRPTVNSLEKGIARYTSLLERQINFVHVGHFHQDWQLTFNNSQLLINGSFIGTSVFSMAKMASGSQPVQVMHVFDPRVGLAITERIYLGEDVARHPASAKKLA
jgi:hypothetical protein